MMTMMMMMIMIMMTSDISSDSKRRKIGELLNGSRMNDDGSFPMDEI